MATALGYVTKQENGGYTGHVNMLALRAEIDIEPVADKTDPRQPDFRVFTRKGRIEIGGGWTKTGKRTGKPYTSFTFAHPALGQNRIFANLGRAAGQDDESLFALLWNPVS